MPDTSPTLKPITVRVKKAAEFSGLSPWTIYKLADQGKIESRYEGSARLILLASLEDYINNLPTERPDVSA
jgi:hypothetical protein